MPKRKSDPTPEKRDPSKNRLGSVEFDERENFVYANIIPSADDSGGSDSDDSIDENVEQSESDSSETEHDCDSLLTAQSYDNVYESYNSSQ